MHFGETINGVAGHKLQPLRNFVHFSLKIYVFLGLEPFCLSFYCLCRSWVDTTCCQWLNNKDHSDGLVRSWRARAVADDFVQCASPHGNLPASLGILTQ